MKYNSITYRKHKQPGGWGTICPPMTQEEAQKLLDESVPVGNSRYNIFEEYCFKAFSHATDEDGVTIWHGFPIKWSDLPSEAKNQLIANGQLTSTEFRKRLRKSASTEFAP
jgi:hypothetical protein